MSVPESFEIEEKRFYVPGVVLSDTCPKCRTEVKRDMRRSYISCPTANAPSDFWFYCGECDHEWKRQVLLTVRLGLLPAVAEDPK